MIYTKFKSLHQVQVAGSELCQVANEKGMASGLDCIDYWLNTIHVHTARNTHSGADNTSLSPPVFIIGTHRHALHHDSNICQQMVKAKFDRIQQMTRNKPYERHIVKHYYAVECGLEDGEDAEVDNLRHHLEDVASREPYMGEQIPLRWLRFECAMVDLVESGTDFVTLSQLQAVAMAESIKETEFHTLLQFYHDLGVIVYYGGAEHCDPILRSTIILRPEWLVVMFTYVLFALPDPNKQCDEDHVLWQRLDMTGVMEERLIDHVWRDITVQKAALLRLMEKFDLICEHLPPKHTTPRGGATGGCSFYVPSRLKNLPTSVKLFTPTEADIVFYLDFNGFLPDGVFQRLLTRVIRWSLERGGHEPLLTYHQARCFLDPEHDLALQVAPLHMARIKACCD
ncbi:hypothetical protein LSAT2_005447 [Lamellibrachia satsuma]|nr:hypothetical protein LSAT2_005447 [Lamellibrachia satsuma]